MHILHLLHSQGISVRIVSEQLIANPTSLITDSHRVAVRANRTRLMEVPKTLEAAINACVDARGDDLTNCQRLLEECLALPLFEQHDLIGHFLEQACMFRAIPNATQLFGHWRSSSHGVQSDSLGEGLTRLASTLPEWLKPP